MFSAKSILAALLAVALLVQLAVNQNKSDADIAPVAQSSSGVKALRVPERALLDGEEEHAAAAVNVESKSIETDKKERDLLWYFSTGGTKNKLLSSSKNTRYQE